MAGNFTEITERPNDKERQAAYQSGTGGYGGEDCDHEELRQTTLPSAES